MNLKIKDTLDLIFASNKKILFEIDNEKIKGSLTFFLQSLIIYEIYFSYDFKKIDTDNYWINAKEIQDNFFEYFNLHKEYLPEKYFNILKSSDKTLSKKIKLKQDLINITVSNADHKKGIKTFKEILFKKDSDSGDTFYKFNFIEIERIGFLNNQINLLNTLKNFEFLTKIFSKIIFINNVNCKRCDKKSDTFSLKENKEEYYHLSIKNIMGICSNCLYKQINKEIGIEIGN